MARAFKSKTIIEERSPEGHWVCLKEGLSSAKEAEAWVIANIKINQTLRVVKISGIFSKTVSISKR